jgi:hypothetical protein
MSKLCEKGDMLSKKHMMVEFQEGIGDRGRSPIWAPVGMVKRRCSLFQGHYGECKKVALFR